MVDDGALTDTDTTCGVAGGVGALSPPPPHADSIAAIDNTNANAPTSNRSARVCGTAFLPIVVSVKWTSTNADGAGPKSIPHAAVIRHRRRR